MKNDPVKKVGLAIFLVFFCQQMVAQGGKTQFPEAEAVYTNLSCEVNIKNDKGNLSATSTYKEDLLLASDKGVKMMGRGSIYHGSFSALKDWEAYTKTPENKKLKVSNINVSSSRQDYVFFDDTKETSFDFTGATTGATRHMEFELLHSDAHLLTPYYFDRYFPLLNGELTVTFPESVKIKYVVKGIHAGKVQFTETRKRDKTSYKFAIQNVQGAPDYEDAPGSAYYATHVIFYIDKVQVDGEWKNFLSTTEDLFRYNYGFIKDLNKDISPELKHITDSLINGAASDLDKTKRLYQWVQSSIKYVAFEEGLEGFIPRQASLVCTRRFGDCKDMASILTAMLTHAKVPAYYTWIGTRRLPYRYSEVPLPIVDNHMICTALVNGQYIFLDGTDSDCVFGIPSSHIQGKEALVAINEKEFKVLPVEIVPKEKNLYQDTTFLELTEKGLTGRIKIYMTGYYASDMHGTLNYKNQKERDEYFRSKFARGNNKIQFTNWKVQQSPDRNASLVTADIDLPNYARKLGDEWLLNMNLFKFYESETIETLKRKSPIEHRYLTSMLFTTVLKMPIDYKASAIPQSQSLKNDVWGFDMQYKTEKESVILSQKFDIDHLMIQPVQFEKWNTVLDNLLPHYKQTLVLSKK
ncbi:MAG: hypothetical protein JWP69_870 [Flaviaesturariibacter sp.]|nr:hypothetical protein [Flaviaesturariibacter sp.]